MKTHDCVACGKNTVRNGPERMGPDGWLCWPCHEELVASIRQQFKQLVWYVEKLIEEAQS